MKIVFLFNKSIIKFMHQIFRTSLFINLHIEDEKEKFHHLL